MLYFGEVTDTMKITITLAISNLTKVFVVNAQLGRLHLEVEDQ